MTKTEFREAVRGLFSEVVVDLSCDERAAIVRQCLVDAQEAQVLDEV
jgi:hypothetical protein